MDDSSISSPWILDHYRANCSGGSEKLSCQLSEKEVAYRDLLAGLRLVLGLLSVLGTSSIIISVIRWRQILNPKIHPIFILSIADFLLGVMWVIGGCLWITGGVDHEHHSRVGCFTVLLITVIVECVAVNLTCVYAMLAYSSIKMKDFSNVYSLFEKDLDKHAWKPWRTITAYVLSWVVPVILIMVPFTIVASAYHLIEEANSCSCWCRPYFGNIVPMAIPRDNDTAFYLHHLSMFVASYALILAGNYLVGFTLLVIVYWKILKLIRKMKANHVIHKGVYGVTYNVIERGQAQAKLRVIYFLTVFIISGFFNLVLSLAFLIYESSLLRRIPSVVSNAPDMEISVLAIYIAQSITVPLQGFLNAIVYGWTREDFLVAVRPDPNNITKQKNKYFGEQTQSSSPDHATPLLLDSSIQGNSMIVREIEKDMLLNIPEQLD